MLVFSKLINAVKTINLKEFILFIILFNFYFRCLFLSLKYNSIYLWFLILECLALTFSFCLLIMLLLYIFLTVKRKKCDIVFLRPESILNTYKLEGFSILFLFQIICNIILLSAVLKIIHIILLGLHLLYRM